MLPERQRLLDLQPLLLQRQHMLAAVREFFDTRGFLAVSTPLRIPTPALEDYIDAEQSGDCFLRTSPELHMKRLLAAGYAKLYQVGPCFREGERGRLHLPEFAMLEWYRLNADYRTVLTDTTQLVRHVAEAVIDQLEIVFRGTPIDLRADWEELTVARAFERYAQQDVHAAIRHGTFEQILVERVEPCLGMHTPTVLLDYPLACGGLAARKQDEPRLLERWELYIAGVELANACTELTDHDEQLKRFTDCAAARRARGQQVYPIDEPFMAALAEGMPPAAGVAVGLDRLLMLLTGAANIADLVPFPEVLEEA